MMRALYSGVSGLKVHQTRMDVIGNNISNVNTVGFKASNVTFADVLYQTTSSATGPNAETGRAGQNPMQVGLGASVSAISTTIDVSGGSQRTDNPFDIMIEGDGFFIVNNGSGNYFTKAGSFKIDANGTLCNASGYAVMGWQVDPKNPTKTVADAVSPLRVMAPENKFSEPEATRAVNFSGNIDSKDSSFDSESGKLTAFSIYDNLGRSYTVNLRLTQVESQAAGADTVAEKIDYLYNVDIVDILDSEGESILVTKDRYGKVASVKQEVTFSFAGINFQVSDNPDPVGSEEYSIVAEGDAHPVLAFDPKNGTFKGVGSSEELDDIFSEDRDSDETFSSIQFTLAIGAGTGNTGVATPDDVNPFPESVDVDFSKMTMFQKSGSTKIEPTKGDVNGLHAGRAAGNLKGITVDRVGMIYGVYDNGISKLLGQVVVATFANPAGLEAVGGNLFAMTQNSGEFDGIGEDVSASGGQFNTGVLEMSNVDLASEFTNMITTQRGFQANSRIITTSDTLLEELINLKR